MPWRYSWRMSAALMLSSKKRRMSLTLPPELKTGSAPVRMITRTESSRATSSHRSTISCTAVLPVRALRVSGWSRVTVQMAPSRSWRRNLLMVFVSG